MSNFHNMDDTILVDQYADLKLQLESIEEKLLDIKSELVERHKTTIFDMSKVALKGIKYAMTISNCTRKPETIIGLLKKFLKDIFSKRQPVQYQMVRTKSVAQKIKVAA